MVEGLSGNHHPSLAYRCLDLVFAAFVLVAGLLTCVIGIDYLSYVISMSSRSYLSVPAWLIAIGLLILTVGLAVAVFGLKRLIGGVAEPKKTVPALR